MTFIENRVLKTGLNAAALMAALLLTACGKPADAPAAPAASAPAAAAPTAAAPAAPAAEKKNDGPDPLAHEGIPGLSDMFSKKKEGEGH